MNSIKTLLLVAVVGSATCLKAQFSIPWSSTTDGGGGSATGGSFSLSGTIGQPDAGAMSGGAFTLEGGFWAGVGNPGTVYEGFDYSPGLGPLLGASGGIGFADAWQAGGFNASVFDNCLIGTDSLIVPGVQRSGNRVQTASSASICGLTRHFTQSLGAPGTTRYLSVILRPEGTLHQGAFNGFFGLYLNASTGADLFVGKPGAGSINRYVLEARGGVGQVSSAHAPVVGSNVLLVVKCEFLAGVDRFTLYVNPAPGNSAPASGAVKFDSDVGTVDGVTLYSTGAFSMDELRLAETYAAAVPALESGLPPGLSIRRGAPVGGVNTVILSWLNPSTGYVLQQTANMSAPGGGWTDVAQTPVIIGSFKEVTLLATGQVGFFRLRRL